MAEMIPKMRALVPAPVGMRFRSTGAPAKQARPASARIGPSCGDPEPAGDLAGKWPQRVSSSRTRMVRAVVPGVRRCGLL
jgi:hypothetical protein